MPSDNIPNDIQFEIIKKVSDIKALFRFRSVSKPWKSFIYSSEFIAGYRARKTYPNTLFLRYKHYSKFMAGYRARKTHLNTSLLRYKEFSNVVQYLSVNNDTFEVQQDLDPNDFMMQFNDLRVIGFSRGLLCLYNIGMFVLCNFSIRRSVSIIEPQGFQVFGFAVCPVTNEPTIVSISLDWKLQIFTLSSKKWTTEIDCVKPRESVTLIDELSQVAIGSCIYRFAYEKTSLQDGYFAIQYMIVSFDFFAKKFIVIDIPDKIRRPSTPTPCFIFSKLKGSLVVIAPCGGGVFKVWKMKPNSSFSELFTIDAPSANIRDILGFRKNGELVVVTQRMMPLRRESALKAYDPCSGHFNNLGFGRPDGSFFISSYKETLHLLDHSDSCVYPDIN